MGLAKKTVFRVATALILSLALIAMLSVLVIVSTAMGEAQAGAFAEEGGGGGAPSGPSAREDALGSPSYDLSPLAQTGVEKVSAVTSVSASVSGKDVADYALKFVGSPYVWGGSTPDGFDCSGLVMYTYAHFGIDLPHSSKLMSAYGVAVDRDNLQPGDLVFFYNPIHHVGLYIGGGKMVDAAGTGEGVRIDRLWSSYNCARRPLPTLYQQTDSHLAYRGTWSGVSTSSASGGRFAYAGGTGSSVTVTFKGTYLAWIAKKSPAYGIAKVILDKRAPVYVNLYSASTVWKQTVWSTGTLTAGVHTVTISWTGTRSSRATATNIGVDAFEVLGTLRKAAVSAPAASSTRYQQTDSHLAYRGTWSGVSTSSASGGRFAYAGGTGSSVTVTFKGTYLAWIAKKSPAYGIAKVILDKRAPVYVNLYSASTVWKQTVWSTGTLTAGVHTVTISWTGTKCAPAGDTNVDVDAVDIVGVLR